MALTLTRRNRLAVSAAGYVLSLTILLSPVGRYCVASTCSWLIDTSQSFIEFSCKLVRNFRSFSLDKLDPTCPQCF